MKLIVAGSPGNSGKPLENCHRNKPKMGKIKLGDFAKAFARVYQQK